MEIEILNGEFAVCQLSKGDSGYDWIDKKHFWSITETDDEISVVCHNKHIPDSIRKETGWTITKIVGVLDFSLVGVMLSVIKPLANRGISVYTISTYNTDYVLVKRSRINDVVSALAESGFTVKGGELE